MGVLDRILGALTGGGAAAATANAAGITREQADWLAKSLQPLETMDKALPDHAFAYVVEGSHETVLLALQQAAGKSPEALLGKPGRLRWRFHVWNDKALSALAEASLANRAKFYASVEAARPPLQLLVRFGKLLAAVDGGRSLDRTGAPVPDWLQMLVNDALHASFNAHGSPDDVAKQRPAWDIGLVARLLAQEELDPMLALQAVFERKDLEARYGGDSLKPLVEAPAVTEFMLAHADAAVLLPTQLSAAGRVKLASRLGHDKTLASRFAPQLVALAADGAKAVRAEAMLHLDAIPLAQRLALLTALLREGDSTQRGQAADLLARLPDAIGRDALDVALAAETSKPVQQAIRSALTRLTAADDAGNVELPPAPAWQPFDDVPLGDAALQLLIANRKEILERDRLGALAEIESNKTNKYQAKWRQGSYEKARGVTDDDMRAALRVLNGTAGDKDKTRARFGEIGQCVLHANRLQASPGFGATHLMRWLAVTRGGHSFWFDDGFQKWLVRQPAGSVDLRALADVLARSDLPVDHVGELGERRHAVAGARLGQRAPRPAHLLGLEGDLVGEARQQVVDVGMRVPDGEVVHRGELGHRVAV